MPFYYDVTQTGVSTNGSAGTVSKHLLVLTPTVAAGKGPANLTALMAAARGSVAGGCILRIAQFATAGSGGSGVTPAKRHPNNPAANTTAANGSYTGGSSTETDRAVVGFPTTGEQGYWIAPTDDAAITLANGGGANGNAEIQSIAGIASVTFEFTLEFNED
jgi:hypothetical protein